EISLILSFSGVFAFLSSTISCSLSAASITSLFNLGTSWYSSISAALVASSAALYFFLSFISSFLAVINLLLVCLICLYRLVVETLQLLFHVH
ncbi:hypothetical protein, partial [Acinetobacter baumannii]|uniref:hypothetical protein n=1 Tax=Acinetobacter baumannii TaxID=470 RepID=UPI001C06607C